MDFEVDRRDFRRTRIVAGGNTALSPGQIRLAVERFALTTNNVTYAVVGDMLDYWGFFPTEAPWGRLPAMGLGSVVESAHPDIATGGRYFGFYPMSSNVVIAVKPLSSTAATQTEGARSTGAVAFRDVGAHRAQHAATYTDFRDVATDAMFDPDKADEFLLLWGMFMTSFLVDDYLGDADAEGGVFRGAGQTLVTSASSKTSICLAACLARRESHHSIGVTSPRNRSFVERLGLYDEVITYDEIDRTDAGVASGLVDMAGSGRGAVGDPHALRRQPEILHRGRRHPLGGNGRRQRPPRAAAGVLLRSRTERQARQGMGSRGVGEPDRPSIPRPSRPHRAMADGGAPDRPRRHRSHLPGTPRGSGRPCHRLRVLNERGQPAMTQTAYLSGWGDLNSRPSVPQLRKGHISQYQRVPKYPSDVGFYNIGVTSRTWG